jgi:hypothetical protein
MRLILFILVLLLGADALLYSGAYTQAAWRAVSGGVQRINQEAREPARAP